MAIGRRCVSASHSNGGLKQGASRCRLGTCVVFANTVRPVKLFFFFLKFKNRTWAYLVRLFDAGLGSGFWGSVLLLGHLWRRQNLRGKEENGESQKQIQIWKRLTHFTPAKRWLTSSGISSKMSAMVWEGQQTINFLTKRMIIIIFFLIFWSIQHVSKYKRQGLKVKCTVWSESLSVWLRSKNYLDYRI